MRKKIVAGNWKMNNSLNETINLINDLKQNVGRTDVKVMISPSFPFLKTAVDQLKDVNIEVVGRLWGAVGANGSGSRLDVEKD